MLKFIISVTSFLAVFIVLSDARTHVSRCPSGAPLPLNVQLNDCKYPPCPLVKNELAVLKMRFKANGYINTLKSNVRAKVSGIAFTRKFHDSHVCDGLTSSSCPLERFENAAYTYKTRVRWPFRDVKVKFTCSLLDQDNREVTCFQVDCYTTSRRIN